MDQIASLIREFPVGSFFIILCLITAISQIIIAFIRRNQPTLQCNCDCCGGDGEDVDDDEDDDE